METQTFIDQHGVEVFTRWWPVDAPAAVVVIAHGASEHSGRYSRFAEALNEAGMAAVALDHRGHGETGRSTGAGRTGAGGGAAVIDDVHEVRARAEARFPGVPVIVFGHSLGSLIAFAYLVDHSAGLAGAVLCGVAANVDDVAGLGELFGGFEAMRDESASDVLSTNNAPFEPARTPFDWLSRDEAEVDRYLADPFCGDANPLTWGFLIDLFSVVAPATERMGDIGCPVLVIAGDQDPAAGMGAFAATMATALDAAGVPTDLTIYEGARHELLNELDRDVVTADLIGWIAAHSSQA